MGLRRTIALALAVAALAGCGAEPAAEADAPPPERAATQTAERGTTPAAPVPAPPAPRAAPAPTPPAPPRDRPVVWVQAGHEPPAEPGYRAQTGAGSGPFGSEVGFTVRLAAALEARLRSAGVDARHTPGQVTPLAAPGAAFVSLHHDAAGGAALVGHAITGAGENYYEGEGFGQPSPVPLPTSAPHRAATSVSPAVEARSRALAERLSAALGRIRTPANGAVAPFAGVADPGANARVSRYYGFYRTEAGARVIVEVGAGGADDAFLAQVDLIADALAPAIVDHLREEPMSAEAAVSGRDSALAGTPPLLPAGKGKR